jgi:hypothetical protein
VQLGLMISFGIHVFHHSSLLSPREMTAAILIVAPALLAAVFWKSEQTLAPRRVRDLWEIYRLAQ